MKLAFKTWLGVAILLCHSSVAESTPINCISINSTVGIDMTNAMATDFKIKKESLLIDKTKMEVAYTTPVSEPLSMLFGEQEKAASGGEKSEDKTTAKEYARSFRENHAKNIVVKFTYENVAHKHDVLLASALVNDDECSVRFNGYIVISREF